MKRILQILALLVVLVAAGTWLATGCLIPKSSPAGHLLDFEIGRFKQYPKTWQAAKHTTGKSHEPAGWKALSLVSGRKLLSAL